MRITSATITNFRCLKDVTVKFDEVTTLIGPNGVGKSSVLRALDWFFNGDQGDPLSSGDVYSGASESRIRVQVDFGDLTLEDRAALGSKYAPEGAETFTAWKTWEDGETRLTGKAVAYAPFEHVREGQSAGERRTRWNELRQKDAALGMPGWSNNDDAHSWMDEWERANPDQLTEAEVSATQLFGFAGQAKLSGLFDFVLITADLRATEETQDTRNSILGRILAKAVDRGQADAEIETLVGGMAEEHEKIMGRHISPQVDSLSNDLTQEVMSLGGAREVEISPVIPELKPQGLKFEVEVDDKGIRTPVSRQGHGFQRSLLTASLKLLASRGAVESGSNVIYLAVEEPELFLHPTSAKSFAASLRSLAENSEAGIQVGYATHSPYFVEPLHFDQIRRIERRHDGQSPSTVEISHATMDEVSTSLDGTLDADKVRRRLDNVCLNELRDALFAPLVVLVEGTTDRAVIEGILNRDDIQASTGIEIACAYGKTNLPLPIAILTHLGIPFVVLHDGDSTLESRMEEAGNPPDQIRSAVEASKAENRRLLALLGHEGEDWPEGEYGSNLFVLSDSLESQIEEHWEDFESQRQVIIEDGRGVEGKDAATYRIAALEAGKLPPFVASLIAQFERRASDSR